MPDQPKRLNEVLDTFAPEGANDRRWHFVEHQLEQVVISARSVVGTLENITNRPESRREGYEADDCLSFMRAMLCDILGAKVSLQSYLSGTDVPERVSRKEL